MALLRYKRPFLDTSVFLAAINGEKLVADGSTRGEVARDILLAAERKEIDLIASTLVAAEIIYKKGSKVPSDEPEPEIDAILNNRDRPVLWVDVDYSLTTEARHLARTHGLAVNDSIHLAAALRAKADVLLRWDREFKGLAKIAGIELLDPYWYGDRPLFDAGVGPHK
jgi:predicted nucleic acid-binding protein